MSTVYLHVGQCGNQIARELWPLLRAETASLQNAQNKNLMINTSSPFFEPSAQGKARPRAILVDTEPKVIN